MSLAVPTTNPERELIVWHQHARKLLRRTFQRRAAEKLDRRSAWAGPGSSLSYGFTWLLKGTDEDQAG